MRIGSGHLARCLNLADALKNQGAEVVFVCRDLPGNLIDLACRRGYMVTRLPAPSESPSQLPTDPPIPPWAVVPWEEDAIETQRALKEHEGTWDWLIVDHYGVAGAWERAMRSLARRVLVVDDYGVRSHDCDVLVDQNVGGKSQQRYVGIVPISADVLLGPSYALLDPSFAEARCRLPTRDGTVNRILILFGGTDPTNETLKALQAQKALNRQDLMATVVIGQANPHRSSIETFCTTNDWTSLHIQSTDIPRLMSESGLSVGGCGMTTWERCCLSLPTIVCAVAENQVPIAAAAHEQGILTYLGRENAISISDYALAIESAISQPNLLRDQSNRAGALCDGRGANRVAQHLLAL